MQKLYMGHNHGGEAIHEKYMNKIHYQATNSMAA